MNAPAKVEKLSAKDFASDQDVRWCPGCGDYAILKAVQKTLADIEASPENTVFVSGIGCAARFPYYIESYGFHTIHGRAPAIATGVKLANPELDVWIVSGDGDALSIGGNHLMHILRRNVDVQFLLFNNEVYGLTKGQYSPTSKIGQRTPSTPHGSVDAPVNATTFALGAGARFVARGIDVAQKQLSPVLARAHAHKGASFVEIYQNCIVYNDGAFATFAEKQVADDNQVYAEHGKPLLFGKEKNKGLHFDRDKLEIETVTIGENGVSEDDVLVHDEKNRTIAGMLARLAPPDFPMVTGVLYCDPTPSYEREVLGQVEKVRGGEPFGDLNEVLRSGHTWTVTG